MLQYKNNRKKENEENIEDILDSEIYREAQKDILRDPKNISFTCIVMVFRCLRYHCLVYGCQC